MKKECSTVSFKNQVISLLSGKKSAYEWGKKVWLFGSVPVRRLLNDLFV